MFTEKPYITILVLPFDAALGTSTYGFTLMQFNSSTMGDFVSIEYALGAATIDEDALRVFQQRWELIRSAALGDPCGLARVAFPAALTASGGAGGLRVIGIDHVGCEDSVEPGHRVCHLLAGGV